MVLMKRGILSDMLVRLAFVLAAILALLFILNQTFCSLELWCYSW